MPILDKYNTLVKPIFTERSSFLKGQNKYLFQVHKDTSKTEIKKVLKEIFKAEVVSVNTINYEGKMKRMGRFEGKRSDWKKAIVTFKEGSSINFIEET
ncbi:MAG: 50S ribosomal protein L23 [Elusimicrobiota bacterium]|jgi:large subunit ribosomal protein L23|nr:50S ribosomal protein L23 [Elusimicrobiota bacterium]